MLPRKTEALLIGDEFRTALTLLDRMWRWGFQCHFAPTLQAASRFANMQPVDVILSERHPSDGTVAQLMNAFCDLPVTAYVCFPVDRGCFWLPVLDHGRNCWGSAALRPKELAQALQRLAQHQPVDPTLSVSRSAELVGQLTL